MGIRKRKLALVCLTTLASTTALLSLHGLLVLEPVAPAWLTVTHPVQRDLQDIAEEGVLRVAVCPDDVAYQVEDGEAHGLAFDLALRLSRRLGMRFEMVPASSPAAAIRDLMRGRADIYATADSGPSSELQNVTWTSSFGSTPPVLIGKDAGAIRSFRDLSGHRIAVVRNTALEGVALRWKQRLGDRLQVDRLPPVLTPLELAAGAARGTWGLVLMDQDRARLEASSQRGLTISATLDASLPVRWALRPNSPQLARVTSKVFGDMRLLGLMADLQRHYYENPTRLEDLRHRSPDSNLPQISPWDGMFRQAAQQQGLDWRLLAAISRAESGHDPTVVGVGGALGLMQLMPETARAFGADDPMDPRQNVNAAARHLRWLYDLLADVAPEDRLSFAVAGYNMGLGHLDDARALASRRGLDPDHWDGQVAVVLPQLEDATVAQELDHGMTHGTLTRDYVTRVLKLFRTYSGVDRPTRRASAGVAAGS